MEALHALCAACWHCDACCCLLTPKVLCVQALLHLRKAVSPEFGPDISPLKLTVDESLPDVLHVKITDAEGKRWQVPRSLLADTASEIAGAPAAPTATQFHRGRSWTT